MNECNDNWKNRSTGMSRRRTVELHSYGPYISRAGSTDRTTRAVFLWWRRRGWLLASAIQWARENNLTTDSIVLADFCLAVMRKRWRAMEAAGRDPKVSHTLT